MATHSQLSSQTSLTSPSSVQTVSVVISHKIVPLRFYYDAEFNSFNFVGAIFSFHLVLISSI